MTPEQEELALLIATQDLDNPGPLNIGDAMFVSETVGHAKELDFLIRSQEFGDICGTGGCQVVMGRRALDAYRTTATGGLMQPYEQDGFGVLSDAGFDESTGVDTALSLQHEGAMLAAGYLMMECDE